MLKKEDILPKLKEYFAKKEEVEFAYLFGSVARGEAYSLSDIDIAVMCKDECNILRLMAEISYLLHFDDVDVVDLKSSKNLRLLKDIIKEGIVLKDSSKRWEWELRKYHQALDFMNHTKVVYGY